MMNKNIILIALMLILVSPMVLADIEIYELNKETDLKFTCTLNNQIPTGASYNITISYPNGTTFIDNAEATAKGNGAFNYTTTFTEAGTYKVQMFCYDGVYSYSGVGYYEITGNGKAAPQGNVILFFSIAFLILIGFALYSLIMSIGHLASLDLDVVDLAKSFGVYFSILGLYMLSQLYLGNTQIDNWLLLFIKIGWITHLIVPMVAFILSITIGSLRKKKVDFGVNRIYRRQKIG